jgi:hypothetical protein
VNWLTFISNLVSSLAWPITVFVIILVLRHQIATLLPNVRHLRYGDFEVEFGKKIEHLKEEIEQANLPRLEAPGPGVLGEVPPVPRTANYLMELADVFPRAAILEAWTEVELAAKEAAARTGMDVHPDRSLKFMTMQTLLETLQRNSQIDKSVPSILRDLRALRNSVAHTRQVDVSTSKAKEYVRLALRVASALRAPTDG